MFGLLLTSVFDRLAAETDEFKTPASRCLQEQCVWHFAAVSPADPVEQEVRSTGDNTSYQQGLLMSDVSIDNKSNGQLKTVH